MVVILAGERCLKVDSHTHILPDGWEESFERVPLRLVKYEHVNDKGFAARLEYKSNGKLFRELKPNCFDADVILQQCDYSGVDVQVMCTVPGMFNYQLPPEDGVAWARFLNDDLARVVNNRPDRLVGLGTLPCQDTEASVKEIQRCLSLGGIRGFQIGSHINAFRGYKEDGVTPNIHNLPLNHPDLRPIFKECARLGACIMIHPWDMEWWCTSEYWQPWLVGMPAETTLAGTALILGGVLSEFPDLRCMLSHGGGALTFLKGRIDWGYKCRPDLVAPDCAELPSKMLKRLYFDSITHDEACLQMLVNDVGAEKVMLGSDYPFPLGEVPSVAPVTEERLLAYPGQLIQDASSLTFHEKKKLLGLTALEWLGLDPDSEMFANRLRDQRVKAQLVRSSNCRGSDESETGNRKEKSVKPISAWSRESDEVGPPSSSSASILLPTVPPQTQFLSTTNMINVDSMSSLDGSNSKVYGPSSVLAYFPIDKKDQSLRLKENPLSETGRQWDARFPASARLRANFPRGEIIAAAGHSLSRPSLRAITAVSGVFEKVNSENSGPHGIHWPNDDQSSEEKLRSNYAYKLHLHQSACTTLAQLLGCQPTDVNLGNGLSDDLIRLVETHIHPEIFGRRRKMLCLATDFNSDLTIVRSYLRKAIIKALLASKPLFESANDALRVALRKDPCACEYYRLRDIFIPSSSSSSFSYGSDHGHGEKAQFDEIERTFLVQVQPTSSGLYSTAAILEAIESHHFEICGALLPSIVFHTSQLLDIPIINAALINRGCLCVWDMAHSVGNVPHNLEKDNVVVAAGCGYKFLNGLPGGPGFIYQNSSLLEELMRNCPDMVQLTPVSGWLSNGRKDAFDAFPVLNQFCADTLQPLTSVQRLRASNPEILALRTLIANLQVVEECGVTAWMALMSALTECLLQALEHFFAAEIASGVFRLISPRDVAERGATVCFSLAGVDTVQLQQAVISDKYRLGYKFEVDLGPKTAGDAPTFRVTAHCCHLSFSDTVNLAFCLHSAFEAGNRHK